MRKLAWLLGLLLVLGACQAKAPEPPQASWRLHVKGTELLDEAGRTVLLRGVNAGGRSKWAPYMPFDFDAQKPGDFEARLAKYLERAQGWGVNVLRLPFTWEAVEPVQGHDDQTFLKRYDALIAAAWQRGMRVIVDFHQDVYSQRFCGDGFPDWTLPPGTAPGPRHHDCPSWFQGYLGDPAVLAAFTDFFANQRGVRDAYEALWERMAARYRDTPGVIGFEVLNEPGHALNGIGEWEAQVLTPFYAHVAAKIHAQAPKALVFLDTSPFDALTGTTQVGKPEGDYLVFAPHWYDPSVYAPGTDVDPDAPKAAMAQWAAARDQWQAPVILGESGYRAGTKNAAPGARALLDALDEQHMHFTWWEYSASKDDWNSEGLSLLNPDGSERAELVAELARPYPTAWTHKPAGKGPKWFWDPVSRTFDVRQDLQSSEPWEATLVLPVGAFPHGYEVTETSPWVKDFEIETLSPGVVRVRCSAGGFKNMEPWVSVEVVGK